MWIKPTVASLTGTLFAFESDSSAANSLGLNQDEFRWFISGNNMYAYIETNTTHMVTTNATMGDTYLIGAAGLTVNQWNCIQMTVETREQNFVGGTALTLEDA